MCQLNSSSDCPHPDYCFRDEFVGMREQCLIKPNLTLEEWLDCNRMPLKALHLFCNAFMSGFFLLFLHLLLFLLFINLNHLKEIKAEILHKINVDCFTWLVYMKSYCRQPSWQTAKENWDSVEFTSTLECVPCPLETEKTGCWSWRSETSDKSEKKRK